MDFHGKVVLVTGGTRGIGYELVRQFATKGAKVLFTYKNSAVEANNLEYELNSEKWNVKGFKLDISNYDETIQTIEDYAQDYGRIDILVNNAGITDDNFLMFMNESSWDQVIDTNLKGAFNCCKAVVPSMISQRAGVIINITSIAGVIGVSSQTNYCASKAGLIGFTKSLSQELASKNIRVNAVAPGYIQTEMIDRVPEKIKRNFMQKVACRRFGTVKEIATVVLFLASEDSSYIYGQTLIVDGGIL